MRCFIAIDIDENVKACVADLQQTLAQSVSLRRSDLRWVAPEALHLTIKFLGETPDTRIMDICRAAESAASRHRCFDLSFRGIGHFGGRNARVLWLGVQAGWEQLTPLQADLETAMDQAGWQKESRRFSAHLTLCRIKSPQAGHRLMEAVAPHTDVDAGISRVEQLTVYQSELHREGPRYTPLGHFPLQP
jgi:2'-5' RNA ligase